MALVPSTKDTPFLDKKTNLRACPHTPHRSLAVRLSSQEAAAGRNENEGGDGLGGGWDGGGKGGVRHRGVGVHCVLARQAAPPTRLHRPRHRAGHRWVAASLNPSIPFPFPCPFIGLFPVISGMFGGMVIMFGWIGWFRRGTNWLGGHQMLDPGRFLGNKDFASPLIISKGKTYWALIKGRCSRHYCIYWISRLWSFCLGRCWGNIDVSLLQRFFSSKALSSMRSGLWIKLRSWLIIVV